MTAEQVMTALVEKLHLSSREEQDALLALAAAIRLQERKRITDILTEGSCYTFEPGKLSLLECRIAHPEDPEEFPPVRAPVVANPELDHGTTNPSSRASNPIGSAPDHQHTGEKPVNAEDRAYIEIVESRIRERQDEAVKKAIREERARCYAIAQGVTITEIPDLTHNPTECYTVGFRTARSEIAHLLRPGTEGSVPG